LASFCLSTVLLRADVDFFNFLGSEVPSFHIARSSSFHQQIAVVSKNAMNWSGVYGASPLIRMTIVIIPRRAVGAKLPPTRVPAGSTPLKLKMKLRAMKGP
jgi:hypothetical protein